MPWGDQYGMVPPPPRDVQEKLRAQFEAADRVKAQRLADAEAFAQAESDGGGSRGGCAGSFALFLGSGLAGASLAAGIAAGLVLRMI